MLVYVLKQNGQPFMPTARFGKVRRLLKAKKAKVVRREPFTIKLLYEPETDVVQECYCGVDTGSKHVGIAVVGNEFVTAENRNHLNLEKDHYIDACVIASGGLEFKELDVIYYKRRVSKGDYQLTKGVRGELKLPTGKIYGFRKFDKVEYLGKEYFIKGRMSKYGYCLFADIFGNKIDFSDMPKGSKTPKLSNCKRISARNSCLCISQVKKEKAIHVLG